MFRTLKKSLFAIRAIPEKVWARFKEWGPWQFLIGWLWGYDFFISYQWKTGSVFAEQLARKLIVKNYDVFLDRSDFASGDDWKEKGLSLIHI